MNDLMLVLYTTVLNNHADDNNLYDIGNDKEETKRLFLKGFDTVIDWIYDAIICL